MLVYLTRYRPTLIDTLNYRMQRTPSDTKNTKSEIKKRDALWTKYKKYSSEQNYKAYKAVRNRVIRYIKDDKFITGSLQDSFAVTRKGFTAMSDDTKL